MVYIYIQNNAKVLLSITETWLTTDDYTLASQLTSDCF